MAAGAGTWNDIGMILRKQKIIMDELEV